MREWRGKSGGRKEGRGSRSEVESISKMQGEAKRWKEAEKGGETHEVPSTRTVRLEVEDVLRVSGEGITVLRRCDSAHAQLDRLVLLQKYARSEQGQEGEGEGQRTVKSHL